MDIREAIDLLNGINAKAKIERMVKDFGGDVVPEEIQSYRDNFKAIRMAVEALEDRVEEESLDTAVKSYFMEISEDVDGVLSISATNDGFNAFEVLGLLTHRQQDVLKQIEGEINPDVISRTVIKD